MTITKKLFLVLSLFVLSLDAHTKKIQGVVIQNYKNIVDFSVHPTEPNIFVLCLEQRAIVHNVKTNQTILAIPSGENKKIMSCAWLSYNDDDGFKPLVIGRNDGTITRYSVDLKNKKYSQKYIFSKFKQPYVNQIIANQTLNESGEDGAVLWNALGGKTNEINDVAEFCAFKKDKDFFAWYRDTIIHNYTIFPDDYNNNNYHEAFLSWVLDRDALQTYIHGDWVDKDGYVTEWLFNFNGKYKGLAHYPADLKIIATACYDVKKDEKPWVYFYNVLTKELVYKFQAHSANNRIESLIYDRNNTDILISGTDDGAIQIWSVDPVEKESYFVVTIKAHESPIKKLDLWRPLTKSKISWFSSLDIKGNLVVRELEDYDNGKKLKEQEN